MAAIRNLVMPDFSFFAEFDQGLSDGVSFRVDEGFAGDDNYSAFAADIVLVEAESLAHDTFEAVAHDCAAQSLACCETDFAFQIRIAGDVKDKIFVGKGAAFGVDFLEVAQDLRFFQFKHW